MWFVKQEMFGMLCETLSLHVGIGSNTTRDSRHVLTFVGFADDVDDLGRLQGELVRLLGDVLLHTLYLRTI